MSFVTAIKSGFANYLNFKGRATRSEFWWWTLFAVIVQILTTGFGDIAGILSLAILLPSIAAQIRRLHDTNRRGWWMLVPIVSLVFLLQPSNPSANRFGPPPPPRVLA